MDCREVDVLVTESDFVVMEIDDIVMELSEARWDQSPLLGADPRKRVWSNMRGAGVH
jgi:hypothetical protein